MSNFMQVTSIEGNRQRLDGGAMFGNAPRVMWQKWIVPDELGRIPLACRCLLIEMAGIKILCEAGIGAFFDPKLAQRFGVESPERHVLLENLKAAGHSRESIDYVILSHLHFDHAGGVLPTYEQIQDGDDSLVFPNAHFVVGREAWERALHPHLRDEASFIPGLTDKLTRSGRLIVLPGVLPGPLREHFEFLPSYGHTPGQMHVLLRGAQHAIFFCGDLIPGRAWVHVPITMGYDRYPEKLIDEKSQILQRAETEGWYLFFTHDPEVAGAQVKRSPSGKYEPVNVKTLFTNEAM